MRAPEEEGAEGGIELDWARVVVVEQAARGTALEEEEEEEEAVKMTPHFSSPAFHLFFPASLLPYCGNASVSVSIAGCRNEIGVLRRYFLL